MEEKIVKKLYRVNQVQCSIGHELIYDEYTVLKETEKCYFINENYSFPSGNIPEGDLLKPYLKGYGSRRCLKDAGKSFAHATKQDALYSFIRRKKRQEKILRAQLSKAENGLRIAEEQYLELTGHKSSFN